MPYEHHQPKWMKVSATSTLFHKKSHSVQPNQIKLKPNDSLTARTVDSKTYPYNKSSGSPRASKTSNKNSFEQRNLSVPRASRNHKPPNFLITSPSSLNKPLQERCKIFNRNEMANVAPFVGNYNVPLQPFTLPDGTKVQANQLKNTF